ncbi:MAG TPA: DUF881 domain-containing protein, partial [Mycobacteriales bacterium]|nr:DUF881 domain-containing protein [Mycobacteriales bacterium]
RLSGRVLAGLLVVGLGTGVAAAQARRRADEVGASRRALVADVRDQTAATDRLAAEASRLRASVSRTRASLLGADAQGRQAAALVAALELVSGAVAVHGPGIVVTLDDAPDAGSGVDDRGGQAGNGRVFDRDVQDVVNALWAAGAEAVSVNDQRLTAQTAIRSAGEAVLVDLRPLSPPYLLRAVGQVDALESAFVDSPTARRFQTWTSLYGLRFQVRRAGDLRLPAAGPPDLRLARTGGTS